MQILCNENDREFFLHSHSLYNNPLVLAFTPFIGSFEMQFKIQPPLKRGLCFRLHDPRVKYITSYEEIPENTYFAIFQDDESYFLFLCLSHRDLTATLSSGPTLFLHSGASREANKARPVVIALKGTSLNETLQRLFSYSLNLTGNVGKLLKEKPSLPTCFEKLGWHSRLAFGKEVDHRNILQTVRSLRNQGFSLGFVIIEEGWQTLSHSLKSHPSLLDFEADSKKFPLGLKGLVEELHEEGIYQVGVWHGIMGYRGGVHARLAKNYDFPPDSYGRYFPGYDLGKTFQFFYDYYAYLKDQGITFVKVGDQESPPDYCRKGMDITRLYKNLQISIQGASSLHFHSAQINTDCMRNENLFYWTNSQLANCGKSENYSTVDQTAFAIRNHLTHALWLRHLMHPDFDAWLSQGDASETLGIFHALSGTINTISDRPGQHNGNLLRKCVLPSGSILKADHPLTLCEESIFVDPLVEQKVYKAYTKKGVSGILALFHLSDPKQTLHCDASPLEIFDLQGSRFAVFSYRHGFIGVIKKTDKLSMKLNGQSDILTFAPIEKGVAVIGSPNLFLASAPIHYFTVESEAMHISSTCISPFLLYCERSILEIRRNENVIPWALDAKCHLLTIDPQAVLSEAPTYYTIIFE